MSSTSKVESDLLRNDFENDVFTYWDTKRNDALNLDLGHADGLYHHHFAVGEFDRSILSLPVERRQDAINAELHRMETQQVNMIVEALDVTSAEARILDAGSGRGGTAMLLHRAFGCFVDGVNFSAYQNEFARAQARKHGCAAKVRFHDRNMTTTGLPDATFDYIISNETTMYVELSEAFTEFARLLKPGGRYVLMTWCGNNTVAPWSAEVEAIDDHYHCHTHSRSAYLRALVDANLIPYQVDDFTEPAIPYWELRAESSLRSGIESAYLTGYRTDRVNYIRIISCLDRPSQRPRES